MSVPASYVAATLASLSVILCASRARAQVQAPGPLRVVLSQEVEISHALARESLAAHLSDVKIQWQVDSATIIAWPEEHEARVREARAFIARKPRGVFAWVEPAINGEASFHVVFASRIQGHEQLLFSQRLSAGSDAQAEELGLRVRAVLDVLARGEHPEGARDMRPQIVEERRRGKVEGVAGDVRGVMMFEVGYLTLMEEFQTERTVYGVVLGVEHLFKEQWSLIFSYALQNTALFEIDGAPVLVYGFPMMLAGRWHPGRARWKWGFGLGALVEVSRARRLYPGTVVTERLSFGASFQPHIRRRFVLLDWLGVDIEAGVEVPVVANEFDAVGEEILRPRGRFRPHVGLSLLLMRNVEKNNVRFSRSGSLE